MATTPRVVAHGTPLPEMVPRDKPSVSVVSCNVLAPLYVRPLDQRTGTVQPFAAFDWISPEETPHVLDLAVRGPRLYQALRHADADVLCLQELQLELDKKEMQWQFPEWLLPLLDDDDYRIHLPPDKQLHQIAQRNLRVLRRATAVTCAILVRKRFEAVSPKELSEDGTNTSVMTCIQSPSDNVPPIVIASVHLDATSEAKRVKQLAQCLVRAHTFSRSVIVAGDWNTECRPGSCVAAFLSDSTTTTETQQREQCVAAHRGAPDDASPTDAQWTEWKRLYAQAQHTVRDLCTTLQRVPTGATRAAWNHDTGDRTMTTWRLDHFLYTAPTLQPQAYWATLEADEEARRTGLPNRRHPSDHLALAAVFGILLSEPHCLSTEKESQLHAQYDTLVQAQTSAMEKLTVAMDNELAKLQVVLYGNTPPQPASKKSQTKKGPPPPEIQEFTRRKRAAVRALQETQKQERRVWVDTLGNLERLWLQKQVGCPAYQWVGQL